VLPIFMRQGWPQAMGHLPWIGGPAPCKPAFSQVTRHRTCRSYGLSCSWLTSDEKMATGGADPLVGYLSCGNAKLASLHLIAPVIAESGWATPLGAAISRTVARSPLLGC
jgi:hypothetical protein